MSKRAVSATSGQTKTKPLQALSTISASAAINVVDVSQQPYAGSGMPMMDSVENLKKAAMIGTGQQRSLFASIAEEKENIDTSNGEIGKDMGAEDPLPFVDDAEIAAVNNTHSSANALQNFNARPMTAPIGMATPSGRGLTRSRIPGEPVMVYLRIRPLLVQQKFKDEAEDTVGLPEHELESKKRMRAMLQERFERLRNATPTVVPTDGVTVSLQPPKESQAYKNAAAMGTSVASGVSGETNGTFSFSRVFGPDSTQAEVFQSAAYPLIGKLFRGQNALIFAYGITNSGKTYTMQGTAENPGIMPNLLRELFAQFREIRSLSVEEQQSTHGIDLSEAVIETSYLEIYQEKIYDLLQPGGRDTRAACRILGSEVVGLRHVEVTSEEEARNVVHLGTKNRIVAQTMLNSDSSRSHSVFTIRLVLPSGESWSKLSIVDLAGAERSSKTGGSGERQKETNNINTSLMQLGRCLEALRFNQMNPKGIQKVVPYRDSKITMLFSDTLSGYGSMAMICNVNPAPSEFDETIHTLKYAAIAKDIKITSRLDTKRGGNTGGGSSLLLTAKRNQAQIKRFEDELEQYTMAFEQADQMRLAKEQEVESLMNTVYALRREIVAKTQEFSLSKERIRAELSSSLERETEQVERLWEQRLRDEVSRFEEREARTLEKWRERLLEAQQEQQRAQAAQQLRAKQLGQVQSAAEEAVEAARAEAQAQAQALLDLSEQAHRAALSRAERTMEERLRAAMEEAEEKQRELEDQLISMREEAEESKRKAEEITSSAKQERESLQESCARDIEDIQRRMEELIRTTEEASQARDEADRERETRRDKEYLALAEKLEAQRQEFAEERAQFESERSSWSRQSDLQQGRAYKGVQAQLETERLAWSVREKEWEEKEAKAKGESALLRAEMNILRENSASKTSEAIEALKAEMEERHRSEITELDAKMRALSLTHQDELEVREGRIKDVTDRIQLLTLKHTNEIEAERSSWSDKLEHAVESERAIRQQIEGELQAALIDKDNQISTLMEDLKRSKQILNQVEIMAPKVAESATAAASNMFTTTRQVVTTTTTTLTMAALPAKTRRTKKGNAENGDGLRIEQIPDEHTETEVKEEITPTDEKQAQKGSHRRHLSDYMQNASFHTLPKDIQESILKKKAPGVPVGLPVPSTPKTARKKLMQDPFAALEGNEIVGTPAKPEAAVALVPVRPPRAGALAKNLPILESPADAMVAEALPIASLDETLQDTLQRRNRAVPPPASPPPVIPPRRGKTATSNPPSSSDEVDESVIERKRSSTEVRRRRRISEGSDDDEDTKTVISAGARSRTRRARTLEDSMESNASSDISQSFSETSDEESYVDLGDNDDEEEEEVEGPKKATKKVRANTKAAEETAAPTGQRRTRRRAAATSSVESTESTSRISSMTDPFSFDEENEAISEAPKTRARARKAKASQ